MALLLLHTFILAVFLEAFGATTKLADHKDL